MVHPTRDIPAHKLRATEAAPKPKAERKKPAPAPKPKAERKQSALDRLKEKGR